MSQAKSSKPPDRTPAGIGARLKLAIKTLGLRQKDVAAAYGCGPSYITEMVRERNRLPVDFTAWLQEEYGVNLNWLFTGRGPMLLSVEQARAVAEDAAHYEALSDERLIIELGRRLGEKARLQRGPERKLLADPGKKGAEK